MSAALPTLVRDPLPDLALAHAERPGGFAWWYVDVVDDDGNGLVAIVSVGLPFLPGYASAARAGRAPAALTRPSVCLVVVQANRIAFWALHEVASDHVDWGRSAVRVGASSLSVHLPSEPDAPVRVEAHLAGTLPGCPWRADLSVEGPLRRPSAGEPDHADHEWSVLTACATARAQVRCTTGPADAPVEQVIDVHGRAYVDRNAGDRSLDGFAVRAWSWGRLAFPDQERIWYEATDRDGAHHSLALAIDAAGNTTVERDAVVTEGRRTGWWGLPRPANVRFDEVSVPLGAPLDDSPFYARLAVTGTRGAGDETSAVGRGFAEVCRPARIDAAWFRPLLRMTVCHDDTPSANSAWLPLFAGPATGRVQRLLGWAR